jgi:hypothetical protein
MDLDTASGRVGRPPAESEVRKRMARRFGQISTAIWNDPEFLAISGTARLLFLAIATQPDLSLIGVAAYTPSRWATRCAVDNVAEIDRALEELEIAGLAVADRSIEEVALRRFLPNETLSTNMKMRAAAARELAGVASPILREALRIADPTDAGIADPAAPGSPFQNRAVLDVDVDVDVDKTDPSKQSFQKRCAPTASENEDEGQDQEGQPEPNRADEALQILAKRVFDSAKARGTPITKPEGYFRECLASQRLRNGRLAASVAAEHPDFPPIRIANCIETPETVTPPMYVPEGVGKGVGFGEPKQ